MLNTQIDEAAKVILHTLYRYQALFTGLVWDRLREQVYQMEDPISRTSLTRPYSVR